MREGAEWTEVNREFPRIAGCRMNPEKATYINACPGVLGSSVDVGSSELLAWSLLVMTCGRV